ncbi:DUF4258 domain-containing protein [Asticcacaulis endophyticus]|uniref:DUF4258 domain-containing protein n=1 Tax=Asticcacaulis endophyticus TaxID=1395890 RepID=A0A918PT97_9CAUL|nr:hypothetical protein GCM10011273_03420 [Asticcacaulis endophyticus]
MTRNRLGASVAVFKPKPQQLLTTIRSLASDSSNVAFTEHALERMELRDITTPDALLVLRTGDIIGDIEPGRSNGEWKCKVVARKRASREVGVVTVVSQLGRLVIKTVEWEDM